MGQSYQKEAIFSTFVPEKNLNFEYLNNQNKKETDEQSNIKSDKI